MKRQLKLFCLRNKSLNNSYLSFDKIFIIVFLLITSFSFAQKNDKLSPAFRYLIEHPIIKGAKTTPPPELYKIDIVKGLNPTTGNYEDGYVCIIYTKFPEVLKANGIAIQSIYSTYVTAWVSLSQISIIENLDGVEFIEAPKIIMPNNDISVGSSGASLLHAGKVNNTVYKGDGVIVAIIDSGIDWDHPDFRNVTDQTKSRILRLWDQTITPISGEVSPTGFSYGVEYTQTQINNEIDGSPAGYVREKDTNGHGTHVAGTAAGNGAALTTFKYSGLAPNADIVVVKGGDGSFTSTNIINALTYLKNLATTLGKPIVVNMSLGGQSSAHDGTDAEEIAVDAFTDSAAGRIVVIASGNDNGTAIHKQNFLASNGNTTVSIVVPTASASTSTGVFQYTCYVNDASAVNATITAPGGTTATRNAGSSGSHSIMGGLATVFFSNSIDPGSGDRKINVYVVRASTAANVAGTWILTLTNATNNSLTIDGWLNYKGSDFANTTLTSGDNNYLVASPGCATKAITVGSYMAKLDWSSSAGSPNSYPSPSQQDNISSFSSIGPRRDNIQKPDISANGQAVVSCLSSDSGLANTDPYLVVNGLYRVEQGTSMATPEVSGCVALLLQINKTATFSQIKTALTSTATKDAFTTALDNNIWGSGKIDVFKAASSQLYCNTRNRVTYSYDAAYTATNNSQTNLGAAKATTRFTPALSGQLGGVYFKAGSTITLTSFTIEVRTNTAGVPGTLLNSLVVTPSSVSKYSWNYYDLSSLNIPVSSGTDYFIVLVPGASSTFYLGQDPASVGRSFYYNGAAWTATNDLRIRSVVYTTENLNPSIALSSEAGSNIQTKCINTSITNITYTTTGVTGATFSGLPSGITGTWASNVVTISGTPLVSGNFNYTVTLTGGCNSVIASGSINVNASTANLSSAVGTNSQTKCINTAITEISYTTTGATGATFSGLPTGVTGNWIANLVTISGTPSAAGTYNYTLTLTGGCSKTATGTIIVNAIATANSGSPNTVCQSSSPAAFSLTGASILGSATTGAWSIISGGGTLSSTAETNYPASVTYTPEANYSGTVTLRLTSNAGTGCTAVSVDRIVTVTSNLTASVTITSNAVNNIICEGTSVIYTANPTNGGLSPSYQWKLNGFDVGTNSNTYTNPSLSNGDIVTVEMTSNATPCLVGSPALAIGITTTVNNCNQTRSAVLSLRAGDETICNGNLAHLIITATGTGLFSGMINGIIPFESYESPINVPVEPGETTTFTITEISDASGPIDASQISGEVQVVVNDCNQTRSAVLSLQAGDETICNGNLAHLIVTATGTGLFSGMINGTIPFESYESPINVPVEPGETTTFAITEISDASGPIDASQISGQVQVIVNDCYQTISAVLSLQAGDETICNGDIAHLSIAVTGTGPWFGNLSDGTNFSGSDNPLLVTVTPTATTTYTIATLSSETATASDADLSGSATVIVNQPTIERTVATSCGMYIWETGNHSDYMTSGTYSYTENCVEHILELTINNNTITSQPVNTTICKAIGGTASLSVATSTATATYKWYTQALATATTGAWTVVANNANYSGAATATLNITKTTSTLPATGTKYKVVITNSCGTVTSNIVSITDFTVLSRVAAVTVVEKLSPLLATCQGNSVNLSLAVGSIGNIQWQSSTDGISYSNVGDSIEQSDLSATNLAMPFNTGALTQSTWFRVVASNGVCNSVNGTAIKITVSAPVTTGSINGGDITVCAPLVSGLDASGNVLTAAITNSTLLTLSDYTDGATILWQKSINYTSATPIWASAGSITNTFTANALTVDTWYRALVTNGACKDVTLPVKITVTKPAKAGIITSAKSVCTGGDIMFTSAAYTGTSIQWEVSTISASTGFTPIADANQLTFAMNAVSYAPLSKFYVRNVVTSGNCTLARSAVKTIIVNPLSVPGTVKGGGTICSGSNGTLSVAGNIGTIQWESSANGTDFVNVPSIVGTAGVNYVSGSSSGIGATYIASNITADTYFRAKISSGACYEAYSNAVQYTIGTDASSGTLAAADQTVCKGTGTTLTLANVIGAIKWWKSTNWTVTSPAWTAVTTSTSGTLATGNLTVATAYKAEVTIGSCSTETSLVVPVLVYAVPLAKTITANVTSPSGASSALAICNTSSTSKVLTIGAGSIGTIQWQKSTTSTTIGFVDIVDEIATSYTISNPSIGANYFRAKFTNSCGASLYGNVFTVYYKDCALGKMASTKVVTKVPFEVLAYPNPSSNNFNLALTTSSSEKVEVIVYDAIGRLINKMEVSPTEVSEMKIGDSYPAGVYNLIVSQGTEMKTLRVIKK